MGFHGDLLPDQQFPAKEHGAAPVVGQKAVVVAAAPAQPEKPLTFWQLLFS